MKRISKSILSAAMGALAVFTITTPVLRAADHGDSPSVASDQNADIADVYFFLDPGDNSQAVLIMTSRGFIVPSEAKNFGIFDPGVKYRFEIESTGDAKPDKFIDVQFTPRVAGESGSAIAQTAKISFIDFKDSTGKKVKGSVTAPATNPSLDATAPTQVITDLSVGADTVKFFAGETDDPFFFDIPAFSRFVASVEAGSPDTTTFNRGRDSFAGYNVMAIALRVPVAMLKGTGNVVGLSAATQRHVVTTIGKPGKLPKGSGSFKNVDRMAIPAVNVALIPFNRKNEYNASSPKDDAKGKFAGDIVATLRALGTQGVDSDGNLTGNLLTLAQVAVLNGDILRLDTTAQNAGTGGGSGANGFPNGRRVGDDVIDIILSLVANGNPFDGIDLSDNVNANDVTFQDTFPFLAPSQQPRDRGGVFPLPDTNLDDNTRN